jgi:hypothetical protein
VFFGAACGDSLGVSDIHVSFHNSKANLEFLSADKIQQTYGFVKKLHIKQKKTLMSQFRSHNKTPKRLLHR